MNRAIRVCRSHGFVSTAKESIIFDMAKLCGVFFSIIIGYTLNGHPIINYLLFIPFQYNINQTYNLIC